MLALRFCLLVSFCLPLITQANPVPVSVATVEMQKPVRELLINGTLAADQYHGLRPCPVGADPR